MSYASVCYAADEVKHAMKGDPVTTVRVRDTPPTARSYVDDNVREVPLAPQQQQQKSMSQRDASSVKSVNVDSGKSDYSLNSDTGKSPQHWSHPSGYEPQTFSESAGTLDCAFSLETNYVALMSFCR